MQIKKCLVIIALCLLLTGCEESIKGIIGDNPATSTGITNDVSKFQKEYKELNSYIEVIIPDDAYIHYASIDEVLEVLNGTGIIYFGRPSCPWCRNVIPVLADVATKNGMMIYYYNPGETKSDDIDKYMTMKNKLSNYLDKDANGNPTMYLPDVYFVKDGNIVGHKLGSASGQKDAYVPLTEEQRNELVSIYEGYIKELK